MDRERVGLFGFRDLGGIFKTSAIDVGKVNTWICRFNHLLDLVLETEAEKMHDEGVKYGAMISHTISSVLAYD